jgi:hypothetical protein
VDYFTPNYKIGFSTPKLSKTGQITPKSVLDSGFATVTAVLPFFFFIYFR